MSRKSGRPETDVNTEIDTWLVGDGSPGSPIHEIDQSPLSRTPPEAAGLLLRRRGEGRRRWRCSGTQRFQRHRDRGVPLGPNGWWAGVVRRHCGDGQCRGGLCAGRRHLFAIAFAAQVITNTLRGPFQIATLLRIGDVSRSCLKGGIILLGASLDLGIIVRTGAEIAADAGGDHRGRVRLRASDWTDNAG